MKLMIPLIPTNEKIVIVLNGAPTPHRAFVLPPEVSRALGCGCSTHSWVWPEDATPIAECNPEPLADGKFVAERVA